MYLDCLKTKDEASEVCKIGIRNCFKAKKPPKERKDKTKEDILQDIQEYYLECNICNEEFADGELYSCENDHWLCRNCKASMRAPTCPTCRDLIQFILLNPHKKGSQRSSQEIY